MRRRFFLKTLARFVLPLLIPLVILGFYSFFVTRNYIQQDLHLNNERSLIQIRNAVDPIFTELDSLSLAFSLDPRITLKLRSLLNSEKVDFSVIDAMKTVQSVINPQINAKQFIDSVYIYLDNDKDNYYDSTGRVYNINDIADLHWFNSFRDKLDSTENQWIESRTVKHTSRISGDKHYITLYQKLYTPGSFSANGVLVVNIHQAYIETILRESHRYSSQVVLMIDDRGGVLAQSRNLTSDITAALSGGEGYLRVGEEDYLLFKVPSLRYNVNYVSLVNSSELYQLPKRLNFLTLALILASFVMACLLSLSITHRNYSNLLSIIDIFESAGKSLPTMSPPRKRRLNEDEYNYILENIINTFVQQNYLEVQLSEKKYRLKAMEMVALQAQMNPHFIINTLKTIYWKTIRLTQGPNDASQMLEAFSHILQYSLRDPSELVSLQEEIHFTQNYISIQKIRYNDSFGVIWHYNTNIKGYHHIKLLLQPLIENSINHGKREGFKFFIKIKIHKIGNLLRFSVIDNGVGMDPCRLAEVRKLLDSENTCNEHIGLANIHKRISIYYGDEYRITVHSRPNLGTAVHFTIPIIDCVLDPGTENCLGEGEEWDR